MEIINQFYNKNESIVYKSILFSLNSLKIDNLELSGIINSYLNHLQNTDFKSDENLIDDFISFLDIYVIDQIVDKIEFSKYKEKRRPFLSEYWRDTNDEVIVTDNWDKNILQQSIIKNKSNLLDLSNINYLDYDNVDVYKFDSLNQFIHANLYLSWERKVIIIINWFVDFYECVEFINRSIHLDSAILAFNVKIWENFFLQYSLFDRKLKDYFINKFPFLFSINKEDCPKVSNDIQSIFKGLLKKGYSIYWEETWKDYVWDSIEETTQKVDWLIKNHKVSKRMKKVYKLRIWADEKKVKELHSRHKRHYERFFHDELLWKPDIIFTNWWATSNDAVLTVLKWLVPDEEMWTSYEFYYENNYYFTNINVNPKKRVLGISPSLLNPIRWLTEEIYSMKVQSRVDEFLCNVESNPDQIYYIVIDSTTKLWDQLSDILKLEKVYDNLVIIWTNSITKFQRGERNYFLWEISIYWNNELTRLIENMVNEKWYDLTKDQVFALPRLRKGELKKNAENRNKNKISFKSWFIKFLEESDLFGLPAFFPEIVDSDFFSFIIPPIPEVIYLNNNWEIPDEMIMDNGGLLTLINSLDLDEDSIEQIINLGNFFYIEWLELLNLTLCDTFWLDGNNIYAPEFPYSFLYSTYKEKKRHNIPVIRIAYWYKLDEKSSFDIWFEFWKMYVFHLNKLFGILN